MGTKEAQAAPAILAQVSADPAPAATPAPAAAPVATAAAAPAAATTAAAPITGVVVPKPAAPWVGLEHCPNMSERMTLVDGLTKAVPWPATGANCHKEGPVTAQQN